MASDYDDDDDDDDDDEGLCVKKVALLGAWWLLNVEDATHIKRVFFVFVKTLVVVVCFFFCFVVWRTHATGSFQKDHPKGVSLF